MADEHRALWDEWEAIYCDADKSGTPTRERGSFYEQNRAEMDAGAVVLWPEVEDLYTLMQMRVESGRTAFEREKQGSPVDPELCEWPEIYFDEHIWFDEWPSDLTVRVIALDPSKGRDARRGDYSAYVLLGIDRAGVIYVEADLARRPTPQMVADGAALCRRFRPDAFGVEANQFQELLCGELAAEFARQGMTYIVPAAIHNHVDKLVRIRRLGPYLSQRRLRFLSSSAVDTDYWSTNCAISQPAHTTTVRTRWKWRCAWRKTSGTAERRATDWAIDCRWDEHMFRISQTTNTAKRLNQSPGYGRSQRPHPGKAPT